jgi:hypothetical protein
MFCLAAGCGDAATGSEPVAPETDTQAQVDATITPDDATTEVDASAGPDDTESTAADTQSDSSTDTSTDEDTEDSVSDDADGGEQGDSSAEDVIDERFFAQENTGLSTDYVFKGVWAGANGEMVLVGNAGAIARRSTEAKWSMLAESTEGASLLNAIAGESRDQLWAVGISGSILEGSPDGFDFFQGPKESLQTLWGATSLDANTAYAVGINGTIAAWDGVQWRRDSGGSGDVTWHGISGSEETIVLVGTSGAIKVSEGGVSTDIASPTSAALLDVFTADGQTFWAVGAAGTIVEGNGGQWTVAASGISPGSLYAIHGSAADNIYAVGQFGSIVHYDGVSWSKVLDVPVSVQTYDLKAVWVDASGKATVSGKEGALIEGSVQNGWSHFGNLTVGASLDAADGHGSGLRVMVGENSSIWRNDGSWSEDAEVPTTQHLRDVCIISETDIWAVGLAGVINHFDGTAWTQFASPVGVGLEVVWARSATEVYAAGASGTIMRYDGESWVVIASETTANLRDVFGFPGGDVWAVGVGGTIMRKGALAWGQTVIDPKVYEDGTEEYYVTNLHGVWGAAPDDVWAVGEAGDIFHYDGESWTFFEDAAFGITLRAIYGLAADDIWAVGSEGHMLHYDGEAWEVWDTGSVATLYDITGDDNGNVFAVGDIGTVLVLQE